MRSNRIAPYPLPSRNGVRDSVATLRDGMVRSWLEPVQAGRFFVHTSSHADRVPDGATAFLIDANQQGQAITTGLL